MVQVLWSTWIKLDRCIASGVNYKCYYVGVHGFAADDECSMGSIAWMQVRYSPVFRHAKPLSPDRCQRCQSLGPPEYAR